MALDRCFTTEDSFVHNPRTKTIYKSVVYLKASIKKNIKILNNDKTKTTSRERSPKDPAPQPGQQRLSPNAQTTTKGKATLLRKSDSQLYSTAATSPVRLSQLPLLYHSTPQHPPFLCSADPLQHTSHTQQSCRQAKCKRFWRCPASLSRTALSSSTAARMSSAPSCSSSCDCTCCCSSPTCLEANTETMQ